jgi:hypothetical protein
MGTQTAIAQQIQSAGADYILTLKANHPTLAQNAYDWWEKYQHEIKNAPANTSEFICEAGHYRVEKRRFWSIPADQVFGQSRIRQWTGLKSLIVEQSSRQLWNKTTHSTRFFLSSLEPDFPQQPRLLLRNTREKYPKKKQNY